MFVLGSRLDWKGYVYLAWPSAEAGMLISMCSTCVRMDCEEKERAPKLLVKRHGLGLRLGLFTWAVTVIALFMPAIATIQC